MIEVDVSAYELGRRGLRFTNPATEAAYRSWHTRRSVTTARVAIIAAAATWVVVLALGPLMVSARQYAETVVLVAISVLPAFTVALATARERHLRWMLPAQVVANTAAGTLIVVIGFTVIDHPELAVAGVVTAAFYGFTVQPLRVGQGLVATLGYLAVNQALAIAWFATGRLGVLGFGIASILPFNTVMTGVLAGIASERNSRLAFRQERIIAAQRAAIDRERARANVAERARELSEALLRLTGAPGGPTSFDDGEVVAGRYRIVRPIGRGGMGQVYEVERVDGGERLALKVMTGSADRLALARFAREAQLAAELRHPNVVGAVDVGVTDDGTLFLVMELVTGESLSELRDAYREPARALPVLRDIASALAAMHARGIVHRDLKPANVLVASERAKVTDFGIAALRAHDTLTVSGDADTIAPAPELTRTGTILGTPMFMAPELAAGAARATPASDVFSFGVVAFELLAGVLPFEVPPVYVAGAATPLAARRPDVAPAIGALIDRCLAMEPAARPTAAELVTALAA